MKILRPMILALAVAALVGAAFAGDEAKPVTVTGKLLCAKCSLQKADAKECQNVIVVNDHDKTTEYYLAKNAVSEEFGHVCKAEKQVTATGSISQKDGKTWMTATKIEQPKGDS